MAARPIFPVAWGRLKTRFDQRQAPGFKGRRKDEPGCRIPEKIGGADNWKSSLRKISFACTQPLISSVSSSEFRRSNVSRMLLNCKSTVTQSVEPAMRISLTLLGNHGSMNQITQATAKIVEPSAIGPL